MTGITKNLQSVPRTLITPDSNSLYNLPRTNPIDFDTPLCRVTSSKKRQARAIQIHHLPTLTFPRSLY